MIKKTAKTRQCVAHATKVVATAVAKSGKLRGKEDESEHRFTHQN
jgi:hypothetical protein